MRIVARDRDEKEGEGREAEIDSAESNREREVYIIRTNRHESPFSQPAPSPVTLHNACSACAQEKSSYTIY